MSGPWLPLHVEEHGTRGRPLVLVHGFGANGYTWRHWVGPLARDFRVLVVDLKGHGSAPMPDDDAYGPGDQADLLVRVIRGRNLERATLVGHSLGGGIALLAALRLAEHEPRHLDSLVLVSSAAFRQRIPPFISWARKRWVGSLLLRLIPPRALIRRVLRSIVHDPATVTAGQVEAYAEPLTSPEGRRAILRAARRIVPDDLDDVVARYPHLRLPTLLLWGRGDAVVPLRLGQRLAGTLPRARLEVLDDCGHIPQEERPGESLRRVRAFLDERER